MRTTQIMSATKKDKDKKEKKEEDKPRQARLPGMKPKPIQEMEDAMDVYVEKRDARMAMGKLEGKAHEKLLKVMKKHGKEEYSNNGRTAIYTNEQKEKVKVTTAKSEDEK